MPLVFCCKQLKHVRGEGVVFIGIFLYGIDFVPLIGCRKSLQDFWLFVEIFGDFVGIFRYSNRYSSSFHS